MSDSAWQLSLTVARDRVADIETKVLALAPLDEPPSLSSFEVPDDPSQWQIDAWFTQPPAEAEVAQALAGHDYELRPSPAVDWIAQSLSHHQQVDAGRFHIYGSHHEVPNKGGINIKVDAGMAFGTGQHETTMGCLQAIDLLARQMSSKRDLGKTLDLGCGTGILALALSHVARTKVLASDIDPEAVKVAKENAADCHQSNRIQFIHAKGLSHRALKGAAPYDVIVANILARPLCQMATDISRAVRPGGWLVLSGLLTTQERMVTRTYRNRGLVFRRRIVIGEWSTLMLENRA